MDNKLYTIEEFEKSSYKDKFPYKCLKCGKIFLKSKQYIIQQKNNTNRIKFCSNHCRGEKTSDILSKFINCKVCNKPFLRNLKYIEKQSNHFCSQSCAATYNNSHFSHSTKRSKLEAYIEQKLNILYPNLIIQYNHTDAIKSQLDIYIPSLKLAFELNGPFHYEPIFGPEALSKIQNNDNRKFQACLEQKIELCIIDTSKQRYFKKTTSDIYLNIIQNIINQKLQNGTSGGR